MGLRRTEKNEWGIERAGRDKLTGLFGASSYIKTLNEIQQTGGAFGIIVLDINSLTCINEKFGESVGNQILVVTAKKLKKCIRETDMAFRTGDDEFSILIRGVCNSEFYEDIIDRIRQSMNRRVVLPEAAIKVGIGAGYARYPENGNDVQSVIKAADSVMYQDKRLQKDEQKTEKVSAYNLSHDSLTGLYNKRGFVEAVRIHLTENPNTNNILLMSNFRDFKMINQVFGVDKGNEILIRMSNLIRERCGRMGIYGRIDSDHFVLLMEKERFRESGMCDVLDDFFYNILGADYQVRLQIGIYDVADPDMDVLGMCDRANIAIRSIKHDSKLAIAWYQDDMMKDTLFENTIISRFDSALKNGEFVPCFQPQVDPDGKLVGAEVLARWNFPGRGIMHPKEFIPVLEKAGVVVQLDRYIWERAAEFLEKWKGTPMEELSLSVNISPRDLYYVNLGDYFQDLMERHGLDPGKLKLEITESTVMSDPEQGAALVEKLRASGFIVEMDDFGSGYSSLNMLKDIHVDVLKIDMGFLHRTDDKKRARIILDFVISMAKTLGMSVITEGVETRDQLEFLVEMGCRIFQGYYFSGPVMLEEFLDRYYSSEKENEKAV